MTRALPARDAPPQTLLAFDPGHRHIGVAVGQTLTGTATPLAALPTRKSEPDWPALSRLVESWEPQAMVVGLPLNMDGTEQDTTHLARRFRNELKARFGVPVHFVDERLSTREARDRLAREGRAGEEDDAVAAQVILEDWFAQRARRELPARPLHHGSILLEDAEVLEHERFDAAQHRLRLHAPRIAEAALPGAFVHIRCDAGLPMRRPMSIMWAERRTGWIEVLFKEVGAGTRLLARKEPGACLSLLGPIGNPFEAQAGCSRPLLIGGGVGIPPIVFLACHWFATRPDLAPLVLLGSELPFPFEACARTGEGMPERARAAMRRLEDLGIESRLASGAGYEGCYPGHVTDLAREWLEGVSPAERKRVAVYACGPAPMLRAATTLAEDHSLPAQACLEEYMACGVGGCAGCTVGIRTPSGPAMKRVCVDGPVFDAHQVVWPTE